MSKSFFKTTVAFLFCTFAFISFSFADTTYIVEKGDTLYSISKKHQLTVAELRAANNLSEKDVLKVGQKLIIPDADIGTATALAATNTTTAQVKKANISNTKEYTVQKGDTLYRIAKNNNISVPDLLTMNNLDNNSVIKVGQKLKIPQGVVSVAENKASYTSADKATATPAATDTRQLGATINADSTTKWPVQNPKITQTKGKVSGVQLSAKENEPVVCIHEGTVMFVGVYRGFGNVVFVQTKTGLIYAYTGMATTKVKKSDYVISGSQIGTVGIDSHSGKPELGFMVFQNGKPMDPAKAPRN